MEKLQVLLNVKVEKRYDPFEVPEVAAACARVEQRLGDEAAWCCGLRAPSR